MTVSIIEIDQRLLSLEFDEEDIPRVIETINSLFQSVTEEQFIVGSSVSFGGANFTFQNEWRDPCLISSTRQGHDYLWQIYGKLKNNQI